MIFALVRNPEGSKDLQAIAAGKKNIHVVQLDLVDLQSIKVRTGFECQQVLN